MNALTSVLIDHREPPWMQRLQLDAPLTVTQLACGDMWIAAADGALLIVERKTVSDLLASIADGRLFEQTAAMVAATPWAYIAVQGVLEPARDGRTLAGGMTTNWQWAAVQGALQTVQELGGCVVYLSGDDADFAAWVKRLAGRDRGPVRAAAPRKTELLAPGMQLLMALPGVGPDRAKALLEQAGTAAFALSALSDDMLNVIGIGPETRAKAREALGLRDGEYLDIVTPTA